MRPRHRHEAGRTALALAGASAVTLGLLHQPLAVFGRVLWGPEHPWSHRDLLGAWWLFWAAGHPGDELALQSWPDGALPLQHHIPNPFDALLLGPLVADLPWPLWWNLLQLGHHLGNVLAATWLCRAAGARAGSSFAAGALVAASPVMLHEIAGGRTLSGAVWPGLLALGLLLRGRSVTAGLLVGLQGLFYVYTGLLVGLVGLILRPCWGLFAALLPMAPYLWWLAPAWTDAQARPPPAGFTSLPLAGLGGLASVPERFRLHPALLLGLLDPLIRRRWRTAAAAILVGLVALGPRPTWALGDPLVVSPVAWVEHLVPALGRMHHPVRSALLLAPLLAVGLARSLDRLPGPWGALAALLALPMTHAVSLAAPWEPPGEPPGADAARWLADQGDGAVVDLTGFHGEALALQPIHQHPMLEGLRKEMSDPARRAGRLRAAVDPWLAGRAVSAETLDALREAGFRWVLVVDRGGERAAAPGLDLSAVRAAVEAQLGPPVAPGVYPL